MCNDPERTREREKQDETGRKEAAKPIGRLRNDMCTVSKKVSQQ